MINLTRGRFPASPDASIDIDAEHYYAVVHWIRSTVHATAVEARTIGVTSCNRGAGVSTVAANLAVAAAQTCERPVLLLDLSGTRATLSTRLAASGDLGLREALAPDSQPRQCVKSSPIPNLSLLAMNEVGTPKALSTDGHQVNKLLSELEPDFDLIVVDLPPTDSGLCFAVAGRLNGVLLVIEAQRTRNDTAIRAKQRLIHANAAILGVILNKHSRELPNWLDARL
jgi:protein-tyrosine kinase